MAALEIVQLASLAERPALADLGRLKRPGEKALALDKSEIIINSATGQLHALWREGALPDELVKLIHDAGQALQAAQSH